MGVSVKICGLKAPEAVAAAVQGGAAFAGFVFHPESPRALTIGEAAPLRALVPPRVRAVALTVDAADDMLEAIVDSLSPDMLQLHGAETPARASQIRRRFRLPIIKAIGVSSRADLRLAARYAQVADLLLFDAKPAPEDANPGGNARSIEWHLLSDLPFQMPWMLAGGLTAENLAEAVRLSGADTVDVSSGVESARGVKDAGLIRRFLDAARAV